jgi:pseudouridine-5'-monophosphatase
MDGLLINSEDLYTIATNAVLREYGKPDLPWHIKAQLQGRPGPEAGKIFRQWAQLPISGEEMTAKVQEHQKVLFPTTKPLPGVPELLEKLERDPRVEIALATSSHRRNYEIKTEHLQELFSVFPKDSVVVGDDPRIGAGKGKPAPYIYLLALETINTRLRAQGEPDIHPEECLVFEDSVPGVEAGRRAGMQVVWCPHPGLLNEYKGREAEVLAGLTGEHKEDGGEKIAEDVKDDIKGKEQRIHARIVGRPGELGDGWAVLLGSLEDFDYEYFGMRSSAAGSAAAL